MNDVQTKALAKIHVAAHELADAISDLEEILDYTLPETQFMAASQQRQRKFLHLQAHRHPSTTDTAKNALEDVMRLRGQ